MATQQHLIRHNFIKIVASRTLCWVWNVSQPVQHQFVIKHQLQAALQNHVKETETEIQKGATQRLTWAIWEILSNSACSYKINKSSSVCTLFYFCLILSFDCTLSRSPFGEVEIQMFRVHTEYGFGFWTCLNSAWTTNNPLCAVALRKTGGVIRLKIWRWEEKIFFISICLHSHDLQLLVDEHMWLVVHINCNKWHIQLTICNRLIECGMLWLWSEH